jgi:DNA/RNA non-specific endonuclease
MILEIVLGACIFAVPVIGLAASPRRAPGRTDLCAMEKALGGASKVCHLLSTGKENVIANHLTKAGFRYYCHVKQMPARTQRRLPGQWCSAWHSIDGEHYYVDEFGRPTRAFALLPHASVHMRRGVRDLSAQYAVGRWGDRAAFLRDYDGGHLIGAQFGGYGRRINLVPQAKTFNRGAWVYVENAIAEAIRQARPGALAYYVRVKYPDEKTDIPSHMGLFLTNRLNGRSRYVEFRNHGNGGWLSWLMRQQAVEFFQGR